jgi:hypothetical protein
MSASIWITRPKPGRSPSRHNRKESFWNCQVVIQREPETSSVSAEFIGTGRSHSERYPGNHPVRVGFTLPAKDAVQVAKALLLACDKHMNLRIRPNGTRKITTLGRRLIAEEIMPKRVAAITFKALRT